MNVSPGPTQLMVISNTQAPLVVREFSGVSLPAPDLPSQTAPVPPRLSHVTSPRTFIVALGIGFLTGVALIPVAIDQFVGATLALGGLCIAAATALDLQRDWLSAALVTTVAGGASLAAYLAGTALLGLEAAAPILRRATQRLPTGGRVATGDSQRGNDR